MLFPATVRLMGLLAMVGALGGCGRDKATAPPAATEDVHAPLTLQDVEVLRKESTALLADLLRILDTLPAADEPLGDDGEGYSPSLRAGVRFVQIMAQECIQKMERAVRSGRDDHARVLRAELREGLERAAEKVRDAVTATSER